METWLMTAMSQAAVKVNSFPPNRSQRSRSVIARLFVTGSYSGISGPESLDSSKRANGGSGKKKRAGAFRAAK